MGGAAGAMRRWRHHLRRARFAATALVAVLLIGAAVFVGLVQLALPLATRHPDFVANQLSERLHRSVRFASIRSEWQPSGPLLSVHDLTLGPGKQGGQSVTLPNAALKFDFGAWLRPRHRWITLRVRDAELRVVRTASGWRVDGFGNAEGRHHARLQSLPVDLDLRDLRVDIVDETAGRAWRLFAPRLRVVNVGAGVRFGGFIRQRGTHQAITVVGRANFVARNYDVYVSTHALDFAAAAKGLDLRGYVIRSGHGDFSAWGHWRAGRLRSATLRYAWTDLGVQGPDGRRVTVPALAGLLHVAHVKDGWDLAWRGPGKHGVATDAAGGIIAHVRGRPGRWRVNAAARKVAIAPWLHALALVPRTPRRLAAWVRQAQPRGHIDAAALAWRQHGPYDLAAHLSSLYSAPVGKVPGLVLARVIVRANRGAMALELPPQPATVAVTYVFRKPFVFHQLAGTVAAWRQNGHWHVGTGDLHFALGGLAGSATADLVWPGHGGRPFLSAFASIRHAKVADARNFWTYRTMPPRTIHWLDDALVGGEVTSGRLLVRGPLGAWPFRHHEGRFEARGVLHDATLDFADRWPRATHMDAVADFIDDGMRIEASHVQMRQVQVSHAVATIPDLHAGVLGLDIAGEDGGGALLDFVRHSPVGAHAIDALSGITVGGTGNFHIQLSIPLHDAKDFTLAGKVDLAAADITAKKWHLVLQDISGPLVLGNRGFAASNLKATFRGAPARLSLAVGSGVDDPADIVEAALDTSTSMQTLAEGYAGLTGIVDHAHGVAPFHVGVKVVAGANGAPAVPELTVRSSLTGIGLYFPAPLDKPAAQAWPLKLTLRLPPAGAPLRVALGNVLHVRGRMADPAAGKPMALAADFGPLAPAQVPASGLVVGGNAPHLDVSGWIRQALAGGSGTNFPPLRAVDVATADAEVFGTGLGALTFKLAAGAKGATVEVDGAAAQGTIRLPPLTSMTDGISANLVRLQWPALPQAKPGASPAPPEAASPVAPASIPPLRVSVGDLRLGKVHLGATTFESTPTAAGMHVVKFDSKGKDFAIQAHGDWDGSAASSQSHFIIDIASRDLGDTLAAFGFRGLLAGGHDTKVHIDGAWPGGPAGFSLAWMDGSLSITAGKGRILAVQPGLGRLLGLLSLRELPRRLALHFGDVFKKGFGFDHATANFRFADGNAFTSDMLIKAPAAKITMQGRVGFRARDFDLVVTTDPHLGVTLPVVGAVVGGPVGAAAGLALQGLLGKGISHAAGNRYSVTGSWDKPKITGLASHPAVAASIAPTTSSAVPQAGPKVAVSAPVLTGTTHRVSAASAVPAPVSSVPVPPASGVP